MSKHTDTPISALVDDMLAEVVNICRIGASPGGPQILEALCPGTAKAVKKAEQAPKKDEKQNE